MNELGRRIFIGDVHGHYQGLMTLLDAISPGKDDQVYFLGDLIDRGPASRQTVEFVKNSSYVCLLGNHEQLMLKAFPNQKAHRPSLLAWFYCGGRETMGSYDETKTLKGHLEWMETLPLYLDLGDIWLVHAGVHPTVPLEKQTAEEFCWIRGEFHSMAQPYFLSKMIVTGHTITFTLPGVQPGQIAMGRGWLDIDTGAYHPKSGWMTGLDWTQKLVYQVNVFNQKVRIRPLSEAIARINLAKLA
jgi:serine/threonine protein phosphatase 1